jgi:hypothetical protein
MKKHIIATICAATKGAISQFSDQRVVLVTAAGVITGDVANVGPLTGENEKDVVIDMPLIFRRVIEDASAKFKQTNGIEGTAPGNDGCIILENATLETGHAGADGNKHNFFPSIAVFFDEIIALSTVDRT